MEDKIKKKALNQDKVYACSSSVQYAVRSVT